MGENKESGWTPGLAGLLAPVILWLGLFFLVPLFLILAYSFGTSGVYGGITLGFNPGNYLKVFDPLYLEIIVHARHSAHEHLTVSDSRLPAGVLHRLQGRRVEVRPHPARHGPVLDELADPGLRLGGHPGRERAGEQGAAIPRDHRSEERRVGKECRSRW